MVQKRALPLVAQWFFLIILLGNTAFPLDAENLWFHTTPEKWNEARVFHRPFDQRYESRLELGHSNVEPATGEREMSPNRTYWSVLAEADHTRPGPWDADLLISNERDSLVRLRIRDYRFVEARWINEKLVYMEIWWGRVLGTYLILDVEREEIVTREMIHDGGDAFMQWQQARQERDRHESGESDTQQEQMISR